MASKSHRSSPARQVIVMFAKPPDACEIRCDGKKKVPVPSVDCCSLIPVNVAKGGN